MTTIGKKLSAGAVAAVVTLALALGGLGLTGLNVETAFAADGADATATPAKKKAKVYKIKYKNVKGVNKNAKTFKYGKTVKLKKLSKKGYKFLGWYSDKYLTKKTTKVGGKTAKNVTVYAKWVQKPRTAEEKIALKQAKAAIKEINKEAAPLVSQLLYEATENMLWIDPAGKKIGCSKKLLADTMKEQTSYSAKVIKFATSNTGTNWYLQALMTANYFADIPADLLDESITVKDIAQLMLQSLEFTDSEIKYALKHMKA